MHHIAIIPARGGSKRLPRKNILDFHGKPMLAWTVEAALSSGQFDRVLVSTDDEEIAEVGRAFGAEVPFLRMQAQDDMATSSQATLVALSQAEAYWATQFDIVTQLMPNCPLRDAEDIRHAVAFFLDNDAHAQISCFRFGWMNPWWSAKLDGKGTPEYLFPEARLSRSQDLPPLYCPSGAIWTAHASMLKSESTFYIPGHVLHPMNWLSAIDIDDAEDLAMAKACYLVRQQNDVGGMA